MSTTGYGKHTFADGELIFSEGDRAVEFYLVLSGKVRIFAKAGNQLREIEVIGKGRIFGEMAVISDMNRMASAMAIGETTAMTCHRNEFQKRLQDVSPKIQSDIRFLISYCQYYLPYEMHDNRPTGPEVEQDDKVAFCLVRIAKSGNLPGKLDKFFLGLYNALLGYAERRIPPHMKP